VVHAVFLGSLYALSGLGFGFQVNMKHFPQQNPVLVLYLAESLHVLHFFLVVVGEVRWLGRRLGIDAGLDLPQALDVHYVLLHSLSLTNDSVRPSLVPHLNSNSFKLYR